MNSIIVEVNSYSTFSPVPCILLDSRPAPASKRPKVTEGRVVIIVSIPGRKREGKGSTQKSHRLTQKLLNYSD